MAKTVLVTGANGQLGMEIRNIVSGHRPGGRSSGTANYIFSDVNEVPGQVTEHLDITDEEAVLAFMRSRKVDVVVNCAAYTDVEKAEGNPETADLLNHLAVAGIAEAARECDAAMIHISTDYVFSGDSSVPYTEGDETVPSSVYGLTKLAGERAVLNSGCRHVILRTAWLYSVHGKNFVKTMMRLTAEKKQVKVVFDQTGTPTCATDLAAFIVDLVQTGRTDLQGIYHFTDEGVCSWYDFAQAICEMAGNDCDVFPCHSDEFPSKVHRPHYSVLDKSLVRETFGVKIPHWRKSLEKCVAALKGENLI